jgi:hypothetical protein
MVREALDEGIPLHQLEMHFDWLDNRQRCRS